MGKATRARNGSGTANKRYESAYAGRDLVRQKPSFRFFCDRRVFPSRPALSGNHGIRVMGTAIVSCRGVHHDLRSTVTGAHASEQ